MCEQTGRLDRTGYEPHVCKSCPSIGESLHVTVLQPPGVLGVFLATMTDVMLLQTTLTRDQSVSRAALLSARTIAACLLLFVHSQAS